MPRVITKAMVEEAGFFLLLLEFWSAKPNAADRKAARKLWEAYGENIRQYYRDDARALLRAALAAEKGPPDA